MNTETKLEPCPFCGNPPVFENSYVTCNTGGCPLEWIPYESIVFSVEKWNRRAPAPEAGLSEEVKEAVVLALDFRKR